MPIIKSRAALQCLVSVRGHPFDRTAFDAMFQAMEGISATMVDQPAAAQLMNPQAMRGYDVLVLYDMPGLDFEAPENPPLYCDPPAELVEGFAGLLQAGKGIVALHHALAGWPTWADYHRWLGGQFFYHAGHWQGADVPDSGYAQEVAYTAQVIADHPVTAGLPAQFALCDELYLAQHHLEGATALLRANASFTRDDFYSAHLAVAGQMQARQGWDHAPGSDVIAWAKQVEKSRLVYIQPGDGGAVYDNPHYRRLVENAIRWVAPSA